MSQFKNPSFPVRLRTAGFLCAALIAPILLTQCKSSKPQYTKVDYAAAKLATPPHRMAPHDYPFDQHGRYRKDWVRGGSSSSSGSGSSSSYTAPRPAPAPTPTPRPKPAARYHTVKSGDTLFAISKRYGTSVARLKSVNGLSRDLIRIGQTLRIP